MLRSRKTFAGRWDSQHCTIFLRLAPVILLLSSSSATVLSGLSPPLRLRGGDGGVKVLNLNQKDPSDVNVRLPDVVIDSIGKFDNWDHRECCVSNAHQWKEYMNEFVKKDLPDIPKIIHQIWIGPKQPPIIWCDSWRVKYRSEYPGWEYKLWTDKEVAKLKLRTQEEYDKESMYQCKADLLRLEVLWNEGGVYIDADMVWLHKDLQNVLNSAKDSGFFCGYEPDTKDKPYSVIGNSFIACTPRHPLVDMLIKYIKVIYAHKRPFHGVEWVTGPLAFTKCISHTQMPFFVPPQIWFYPKFHYVPNPDAINLNDFQESYAFQFGYTCSGLEGWVTDSINRIVVDYFWVDKCPQLRDRQWPLGRVKQLPDSMPTAPPAEIPKVIHQFSFQGDKPDRLMKTWAEDFCEAHPDWTYKCWNWFPDLKGDYFGCSMYSDKPWGMNSLMMETFALEVLYNHGGYHVPLSVGWSAKSTVMALAGPGDLAASAGVTCPILMPSLDPGKEGTCFSAMAVASGFVEHEGLGIVGGSAGAGKLLNKIKELLGRSEFPVTCKELAPRCIVPLDSQTSYLEFPQWSRFLGAEYIFDLCDSEQTERDAVAWGYDSVVPAYGLPRKHFAALKGVDGRFVAVTSPDLYHYRSLLDAVPGFINDMDRNHGPTGWSFVCLVLQWKAGNDDSQLVEMKDTNLPGDSKFVGFVANKGAGALIPHELKSVQEDNGQLCQALLASRHTVKGQALKIGMGMRRWIWAPDDPRAAGE